MPEVYANRLERGKDALVALERGLSDGRDFVAGGDYSIADIALYAYVHCADDAGADPRGTSTSRPGSTGSRPRPASRTTSSRCPRTRSSGPSERYGRAT